MITIRALRESDTSLLYQWINDPEVIQFTNTFRPISEMEQKEWFSNIAYFKNNYIFGIEHIKDKKLIGTCGLYDFDTISHKAELRMKIGNRSYRGKGIGTEALAKLLNFGFDDLNLHKIWLRVLTDNQAAVKLYENAGFQHEGKLREDMYIRGVYHDLYIMSVLRKNYLAKIKKENHV